MGILDVCGYCNLEWIAIYRIFRDINNLHKKHQSFFGNAHMYVGRNTRSKDDQGFTRETHMRAQSETINVMPCVSTIHCTRRSHASPTEWPRTFPMYHVCERRTQPGLRANHARRNYARTSKARQCCQHPCKEQTNGTYGSLQGVRLQRAHNMRIGFWHVVRTDEPRRAWIGGHGRERACRVSVGG